MLEWLAELRMALRLLLVIKDATQEQPNGRGVQDKVLGGGAQSFLSLGGPPSQRLDVFTHTKAFKTLLFRSFNESFIAWTQLAIADSTQPPAPPPSPEDGGWS